MLLDARGQPIVQGGDAMVDQIAELVKYFDEDPSNWEKLEGKFDEQLTLARGHAGGIVKVANGQLLINMQDEVGAVLGRLLADIVIKALVLKAREERVEGKVIPMPKREVAPDAPAT